MAQSQKDQQEVQECTFKPQLVSTFESTKQPRKLSAKAKKQNMIQEIFKNSRESDAHLWKPDEQDPSALKDKVSHIR
jgi:hypothetical protein